MEGPGDCGDPPNFAALRRGLPIYNNKDEFLQLIRCHQVVICVGETGSGKSTQLTQYLMEAGYGEEGRIGCTQPRRLAAKTLATRVAQEMGVELGRKVGYQIRFDNKTGDDTVISYMTDGILVQEFAKEPQIYRYSVIVLDEAHQRHLQTDILLGLLKFCLKSRPTFKVVVTSATLDVAKFSRYFDDAPSLDVTGRMFPVEILYDPPNRGPELDYMYRCVDTVMKIHRNQPPGDILIFLVGQEEIEKCCELLSRNDPVNLHVLPCYGALLMEEQDLVLNSAPIGKRKVVVATNIAETSLTIDGIVYVVDPGMANESVYDPSTGVNHLVSKRISQAEADQRKGRAGRTREGQVYRLYTQFEFNEMAKTPTPEIQRSNLESVILLLMAHGIADVKKFDFMDAPRPQMMNYALTNLQDLGAITRPDCQLTTIGRKMATLPVDPWLAKILMTSGQLNCCEDTIKIVAILSASETAGRIFYQPRKFGDLPKKKHAAFFKPQGDHLTLLNLFDTWLDNIAHSQSWCRANFVNENALNEADDIRSQLQSILKAQLIYTEKTYRPSVSSLRQGSSVDDDERSKKIQEVFASGYFNQIARKVSKFGYVTYSNPNRNEQCYIHPGSSLFKAVPIPEWLIYENMTRRSGKKTYMTNCLAVDPRAIKIHAPNFYPKLQTTLMKSEFGNPSSSTGNFTLDNLTSFVDFLMKDHV